MPISRRLRQLLKRLATLERHLLPDTFSLTGRYSSKQNDLTKSYLLLAHAELEAYFEDRAKHCVTLAHARWQRNRTCSPVLSRLLVYHQSAEKNEFEGVTDKGVTKAINYYLDRLDKNHGIKERNLFGIFLPLGINHAQLDARLFASCRQLAERRGEFAHASFKTHQQVDPKTERDNINKNVVPEVKRLVVAMTKLR